MSKRVLFYARYSTDRQDEQSIETQIALGRKFVADKGWILVEIFQDQAISGTNLKLRPGIQSLLQRIKLNDIEVVLCVSVDRISRDMEHSAGIMKQLRHRQIELWTVQNGAPVQDMELGFRSVISHEMIENTRYRTREGMKTAARKGKIAGGLSYGYRIKAEYDARGDRIPGLREIDVEQARIIRWIFQEYADGKSPSMIAQELNRQGIDGPRGARWRDTAIRGHVNRGTGILNNEAYCGRVIFNRRRFAKNPDTERREARMNDATEWVVGENPELRIIDDALWNRVKAKQRDVRDNFEATATNSLNKTHRPSYLLSGILRCAVCAGPYAIMAKDRYGCTNRQKKLPIDDLGGIVCTNSKTITRRELEDRVLTCVPNALWTRFNINEIVAGMKQRLDAKFAQSTANLPKLEERIKAKTKEQKVVLQQVTDRLLSGKPAIAALDQMVDDLEIDISAMKAEVEAAKSAGPGTEPRPSDEATPEAVEIIMNAVLYHMREDADTETKQPFIRMIRSLIQMVEIGMPVEGNDAELKVYGQIVGILAAMDAAKAMEAEYKTASAHEYHKLIGDGVLDTNAKRDQFQRLCDEELIKKRKYWKDIQVSVVAGAGFEPAAFRL